MDQWHAHVFVATLGSHPLTASYGGDANYLPSTSAAVSQTVGKANSATALTASPNPATTSQAVTLTATVTGSSPTGTVTFLDGTTTLGTGALTNGTASLSYTFANAGNHPLTASYGGDASNNASTSPITTQGVATTATVYYIQPDQLGTPRSVTDTSGNLVWQYDNADPFGNNTPNENPSNLGAFHLNLRFPGQYYDAETGLSQNYFRDYDASIGRYIESDLIGLDGGINTYTYVEGNPLSDVDALGLQEGAVPGSCPLCHSGPGGGGTGAVGGSSTTSPYASPFDSRDLRDREQAMEARDARYSGLRQQEYLRAKKFCDEPPRGNDCAARSRQIDHAKACIKLYEAWDLKWFPGRHDKKLQTWKNRLQLLKDEHNRKCTNKCPW